MLSGECPFRLMVSGKCPSGKKFSDERLSEITWSSIKFTGFYHSGKWFSEKCCQINDQERSQSIQPLTENINQQ